MSPFLSVCNLVSIIEDGWVKGDQNTVYCLIQEKSSTKVTKATAQNHSAGWSSSLVRQLKRYKLQISISYIFQVSRVREASG